MIHILFPIVFAAEEAAAAFAILIFIVPIALLFYLALPSIVLYRLTKKYNTNQRIVTFLLYFGLLALLVTEFATLPTFGSSNVIISQFIGVGTLLLLSIPITYPIGIWIIGLLNSRHNHKATLQN
jgi:hypothetical protein